jgi:hypothetical protein
MWHQCQRGRTKGDHWRLEHTESGFFLDGDISLLVSGSELAPPSDGLAIAEENVSVPISWLTAARSRVQNNLREGCHNQSQECK